MLSFGINIQRVSYICRSLATWDTVTFWSSVANCVVVDWVAVMSVTAPFFERHPVSSTLTSHISANETSKRIGGIDVIFVEVAATLHACHCGDDGTKLCFFYGVQRFMGCDACCHGHVPEIGSCIVFVGRCPPGNEFIEGVAWLAMA